MIATVIPINLVINYEPNRASIFWVCKYLSKMTYITGLDINQEME